jgi:hypothetical protein
VKSVTLGSSSGGVHDVARDLFLFAREYPSEMVNGWPRSYRRWVMGLSRLHRDRARQRLDDAEVLTVGTKQLLPGYHQRWEMIQKLLAGDQ